MGNGATTKAFPESGTPTQKQVDAAIDFLTDTNEFAQYLDQKVLAAPELGKEYAELLVKEAKEYVTAKIQEVNKKNNQETTENPLVKTVKEKMEAIQPMVEILQKIKQAPTSVKDVLEWAQNTAEYFVLMYEQLNKPLADLIKFSTFLVSYTTQYAGNVAILLATLTKLLNDIQDLEKKIK